MNVNKNLYLKRIEKKCTHAIKTIAKEIKQLLRKI